MIISCIRKAEVKTVSTIVVLLNNELPVPTKPVSTNQGENLFLSPNIPNSDTIVIQFFHPLFKSRP